MLRLPSAARHLALVTTLTLTTVLSTSACAVPEGEGEGDDVAAHESAVTGQGLPWFRTYVKQVVAASSNRVLGSATDTLSTTSSLTKRRDYAGRELYAFSL